MSIYPMGIIIVVDSALLPKFIKLLSMFEIGDDSLISLDISLGFFYERYTCLLPKMQESNDASTKGYVLLSFV
jgi:hypothetical protein